MTAPVLALPRRKGLFRVLTDASAVATAGILEQQQEDGTFHPIAYCSKRLHGAEVRYPPRELECLGIIHAITRWRNYLISSPFQLLTDHQSLEHLRTQPKVTGRMARWLDTLAEFECEVKYRPGRSMAAPDALSRAPVVAAVQATAVETAVRVMASGAETATAAAATTETEHGETPALAELLQRIKDGYEEEAVVKERIKLLEEGTKSARTRNWRLRDGLLMQNVPQGERVCIPRVKELRERISCVPVTTVPWLVTPGETARLHWFDASTCGRG